MVVVKRDPGRRGHVQTDSEADYDAWHYDDGVTMMMTMTMMIDDGDGGGSSTSSINICTNTMVLGHAVDSHKRL